MKWIDADKRKPEYDHDVVVAFDDGGVYVAAWHGDAWKLCGHNDRAFQKITYWAHFPETPNAEITGSALLRSPG